MQEPYFLFTNKIHNNRIIEFFDHHFKHQQLLHFVSYKSLGRGHLTEKQKKRFPDNIFIFQKTII